MEDTLKFKNKKEDYKIDKKNKILYKELMKIKEFKKFIANNKNVVLQPITYLKDKLIFKGESKYPDINLKKKKDKIENNFEISFNTDLNKPFSIECFSYKQYEEYNPATKSKKEFWSQPVQKNIKKNDINVKSINDKLFKILQKYIDLEILPRKYEEEKIHLSEENSKELAKKLGILYDECTTFEVALDNNCIVIRYVIGDIFISKIIKEVNYKDGDKNKLIIYEDSFTNEEDSDTIFKKKIDFFIEDDDNINQGIYKKLLEYSRNLYTKETVKYKKEHQKELLHLHIARLGNTEKNLGDERIYYPNDGFYILNFQDNDNTEEIKNLLPKEINYDLKKEVKISFIKIFQNKLVVKLSNNTNYIYTIENGNIKRKKYILNSEGKSLCDSTLLINIEKDSKIFDNLNKFFSYFVETNNDINGETCLETSKQKNNVGLKYLTNQVEDFNNFINTKLPYTRKPIPFICDYETQKNNLNFNITNWYSKFFNDDSEDSSSNNFFKSVKIYKNILIIELNDGTIGKYYKNSKNQILCNYYKDNLCISRCQKLDDEDIIVFNDIFKLYDKLDKQVYENNINNIISNKIIFNPKNKKEATVSEKILSEMMIDIQNKNINIYDEQPHLKLLSKYAKFYNSQGEIFDIKFLEESKEYFKNLLINSLSSNDKNYKVYMEALNNLKNLELSYLGCGGFSLVIKLKIDNLKNNIKKYKEFAIKIGEIANFQKYILYNKLKNKIKNCSQLKGLNLVVQDNQHIFEEIYNYANKGDLYSNFYKNGYQYTDDEKILEKRKNYAIQMIEGFCNLSSLEIYHRDIKLSNFLLKENDKVLLNDFGISTVKKSGSDILGTYNFWSPEMFMHYFNKSLYQYGNDNKSLIYSKNIDYNKSDIWSLGISILALYGYNITISDNVTVSEEEFKQQILDVDWIMYLDFSDIPTDIMELLKKMLVIDPNDRIDLKTLIDELKILINDNKANYIKQNQKPVEKKILSKLNFNNFEPVRPQSVIVNNNLVNINNSSSVSLATNKSNEFNMIQLNQETNKVVREYCCLKDAKDTKANRLTIVKEYDNIGKLKFCIIAKKGEKIEEINTPNTSLNKNNFTIQNGIKQYFTNGKIDMIIKYDNGKPSKIMTGEFDEKGNLIKGQLYLLNTLVSSNVLVAKIININTNNLNLELKINSMDVKLKQIFESNKKPKIQQITKCLKVKNYSINKNIPKYNNFCNIEYNHKEYIKNNYNSLDR